MKKILIFVGVFLSLCVFGMGNIQAQSYGDNAGAIVTEDSLLSPGYKKIVFVVARDISGPTRMELSTYSNEGIINRFTPLSFPDGLKRGQIIPIYNGELNVFNSTPWLYFWVHIIGTTEIYYCQTMLPVGYKEAYKEPMITSITETGGYIEPYQILGRGIFDTTIPSLILINTNLFVSPKTITQTAPGMIKFSLAPSINSQFPPGKYLLTICQEGRCDTLEGRHR